MNLKKFQKMSTEAVKSMDKKMKISHGIDTTFVHLIEEIGELSRIIYNIRTGRFKNKKEEMEEEFADVLALISHLATLHKIDLSEALEKRSKQWKKRNE